MWIKNKNHGQKFELTPTEYEDKIVSKGFAHKYGVIEDDKPIELKQLSAELFKKKQIVKNK